LDSIACVTAASVCRAAPSSGTEAAMKNLRVIEGRSGGVAPEPSAPVVRRRRGWTLTARCAPRGRRTRDGADDGRFSMVVDPVPFSAEMSGGPG
jgi:hypothetical protein